MLKAFLLVTGTISFLYFLFPATFGKLNPGTKDVLGVQKFNAQINKSTIETALLTYCINEGTLPEKLNGLYDGYLDAKARLDLEKLYDYQVLDPENCEYSVVAIGR